MSETQKFMGRYQMLDRLTAQMGGNRDAAIAVLRKRGHMEPNSEKFTAEGRARDRMTAEERAKDRAAKKEGTTPGAFTYDPKTNAATRKKS